MPDRRTPFNNLPERETLLDFLDYLRESVIVKASGISDQDARKPMVPSGTSLMWLLKHLTVTDEYWFHANFAGESWDEPSQDVVDGDTVESAVAAYRAAIEHSNEIVRAADDLDTLAQNPHPRGGRMSLRWILVHMVEETGRHAGHADIIREQLDGAVGR